MPRSPRRWTLLSSEAHRFMFFLGALQAIAAMAWWLPDVAARHLAMRVGRVTQPWARNCLAVGLSQGFIEPLEATALHLVQETIEAFVEAYTKDDFGPRYRDAFNKEINDRFEGVRDYIVCRYRMNTRTDTQYWRDCAANERISDTLRQLLACWFAGGDLVAEIRRLGIGLWFGELSWHCLLGGYGIYPDASGMRPPTPREFRFDIAKIAEFVDRVTLNFPSHEQALAELRQHD